MAALGVPYEKAQWRQVAGIVRETPEPVWDETGVKRAR